VRLEDEARPKPVTSGFASSEADDIGEMGTDEVAADAPSNDTVTPIRGRGQAGGQGTCPLCHAAGRVVGGRS
jgi:hypothetical protein